MLKKSLLALSAAALLMGGCSSYPDDAKGVAIGACEAMKSLNFEELKTYSVESAHAQLDQAAKMIEASKEMLKALPAEQREKAEKAMNEQLDKMKSLDCSSMEVKDGINGKKIASLANAPRMMRSIDLVQIDGKWKISK